MTSTDHTSERSSIRQVVAASFIGTTIEWYDLLLYGTAAAWCSTSCSSPGASGSAVSGAGRC